MLIRSSDTPLVNNIKAASSEAILCHVKGSENPADLLTRGINSDFFLKSDLVGRASLVGRIWASRSVQ